MRTVLALLLALGLAGPALADIAEPKGRVLLTVGGELPVANAPGGHPDDVNFAGYLDLEYRKAAAFDDDMLSALPQHEVKAALFGAPDAATYSGPLLSDVLRASGAEGRKALPMAFDGYQVEIDWQNIETYQPILATHADGKPLPIGGLGPAIVVYPVAADDADYETLNALQVYSLFFIGVE